MAVSSTPAGSAATSLAKVGVCGGRNPISTHERDSFLSHADCRGPVSVQHEKKKKRVWVCVATGMTVIISHEE